MPNRLAAALLLAALPVAALAQPSQTGTGVAATQAWSRATPPGAQAAAVYVTLKAPAADRLVAVSTPAAKKAEIHQILMDGAVMKMRELPGGLPLPPGQPVSLQPGGYHVMLLGLAEPLKLGDTFPVHLVFERAPPIDLVARVAAVGASEPPAATP